MNKKPGRVLLICIIVLAIICPLHIYHDKKKVEDIKSGAIVSKIQKHLLMNYIQNLHIYGCFHMEL